MTTQILTKCQQRAESLARMVVAQQQAYEALKNNRCPLCGNTVYSNNTLAGWVQCDGFPAHSHRRAGHLDDPKCNWQGFTE
jgi:hypothetical protein